MLHRKAEYALPHRGRQAKILRFGWPLALATTSCQLLLDIDPNVAIVDDAAGTEGNDAEVSVATCVPEDASTENVYYRHFDWRNGDAGASVDYDQDANPDAFAGVPGEIIVTLTEDGGGWEALVPLDAGLLNTCPYGRLIFELEATKSNQTWECFLVGPDGAPVMTPVTWTTGEPIGWLSASIPLPRLNENGTPVSGLVIRNTTGHTGDVWYLNLIGFASGSVYNL